ncbi:MAG: tetratricopeptide repeat protein, partial [Pseudomonadota bacterium]
MRRALALLLLAGCGGPHSGPARALEEYEQGRRLIEEGQPLQAAERFGRAAEADPGHSLLVSWQAWALASGGQVEEAIALLQAAPGARLPEDLYNLGAWSARLGRDEEALASLTRAIAADPSLRTRLADDPDLAALQGRLHGLHALGEEPLRALMIGEEGAILAGESYDLELVVQSAAGRALALSWDQPLPAGFTLRRAVDEVAAGRGGAGELRTLTWRVRAAAPGEGDLGPWTLTVGAEQQALPAVPWQVLLPEGVEPPAPGPAAGPD